MKNKPADELRNSINKVSLKLLKFNSQSLETCNTSNKMYNRLLIQRAFLRKKLKNLQSRNLLSFITRKFQKRTGPKLICDYFK